MYEKTKNEPLQILDLPLLEELPAEVAVDYSGGAVPSQTEVLTLIDQQLLSSLGIGLDTLPQQSQEYIQNIAQGWVNYLNLIEGLG